MKTCEHCGKSMQGMKDANRRKFCSRECMRQNWLKRPLTNKSTAHYRARALRKDACERCGATTRLQVHHKDRNPLNDSVENLETLCSTCHHTEHTVEILSTCAVCGKKFRAASHRNRNKICSAPCAKEWGRMNAEKRWGHRASDDCAPTETPSSPSRPKRSSKR